MKVTIVVPLYNKESYVRRAIASVLAQTHQDFALLVIDDGSKDASAEIVRSIKDPRIRLIQQPNGGVSVARNTGIGLAGTDWIAFLDADDEWRPEFLQKTVAYAHAYPEVVAVFTNYLDTGIREATLDNAIPSGNVPDYFRFCMSNKGAGMWSSSSLVRRDSLNAIGGFPVGVKHGEDKDTWTRLAWLGKPIGYVGEVLAVYYSDNPGSAMNSAPQTIATFPQCVHSYAQWRAEGRVPAALVDGTLDFLNYNLIEYAYHLTSAGQKRAARQVLLRRCSFRRSPKKLYVKFLLRTLLPDSLRSKWELSRRSALQQRLLAREQA